MYATSIHTQSAALAHDPSVSRDAQFSKTLGLLYRRRCADLRAIARRSNPNGADAWDAVHDAFVHILEHPPRDTSERSLSAALDDAVRMACGRQARRIADDASLRIALRKRSNV